MMIDYLWYITQSFFNVVNVIQLKDECLRHTFGEPAVGVFGSPFLGVMAEVSFPDQTLPEAVATSVLLA